MSDVMLFGVLKMPYEMAMASELSRLHFYQRVQQLVARVEAQPEQEPVAIADCGEAGHDDGCCGNRECLPSFRTTPPKRPWVGLTDDEASWCQAPSTIQTWKRIEAKLKEKNT